MELSLRSSANNPSKALRKEFKKTEPSCQIIFDTRVSICLRICLLLVLLRSKNHTVTMTFFSANKMDIDARRLGMAQRSTRIVDETSALSQEFLSLVKKCPAEHGVLIPNEGDRIFLIG